MQRLILALITAVLLTVPHFARAHYDPVAGRFLSGDPLGHTASQDLYSFCGGDPVNRFDPDGRDPAFTPGLPNIFTGLTVQQEFQASRLAAPPTVALAIGMLTGGAAAPLLSGWGASTTFTVTGSGIVGGITGDFAGQSLQIGMGDRNSYSVQQMAWSGLIGAGLNYGVNRIMSPNVLSGQIGARQIGNLGQAQAVADIGPGNVQGEQIRFQTPEGNPTLDILARDASTPSGLRGVEVKVGGANLTNPQQFGYPEIEAGNGTPVGMAAKQAGLAVGQPLAPTPIDVWRYQPYEFLPFSPSTGSAIGASAGIFGGDLSMFLTPGSTYIQQDPTGKWIKHK